MEDGGKILFNIWDTCGQERFRRITSTYYRDSEAALITYDITDHESFRKVGYWLEELKKHVHKD